LQRENKIKLKKKVREEPKLNLTEINCPEHTDILKINIPKDKHFDNYHFEVCERLDEFWIFFKKSPTLKKTNRNNN